MIEPNCRQVQQFAYLNVRDLIGQRLGLVMRLCRGSILRLMLYFLVICNNFVVTNDFRDVEITSCHKIETV